MPDDPALRTILAVDDSPQNLALLSEILGGDYRVLVATSGEKALRVVEAGEHPPDLILLDVMMPGMDGYQVFGHLRANPHTAEVPVIFVTALDNVSAELQGLAAGAADYITKPVVPALLQARVRMQLELRTAQQRLRRDNGWLEAEIRRRIADIETTELVTMRALAHLAETRDPETGNHIIRTQSYVRALARSLRNHPRFSAMLTEDFIELLARSAPLHDIGKVGIPDSILKKPGPLTPEEWEIMKTHARLGAEAIELAERDADRPVAFLALAKEIAHWHHERWDGKGYPDGLRGVAIPVSARLMALADVFDALVTPRVYKPPMSYEQARQIIAQGRESHFDPDLVDAFLASFDEFVAIAERHRDPEKAV